MATLNDNRTDQDRVVELVKAAQAGDRAAMGELFERFERHVFAVALRRCGNYTEAQEVCQDVFVQAMTKIGQLRDPACFGGWLRSIAHRTVINRAVRRRPTIAADPDVLEASQVSDDTPLTLTLDREQAGQVHIGLDRLRKMDRETLVAFYFRGQSLAEMSHRFDAPVGTIKRRLHVARKRLAQEVEPMVAV